MHRTHRGSETGVGWSPQHNRGNVCHGSFSPGSGLYDLDVVCVLEPLPKWSHAGVVRGFVAMAQRAKPNVTGTGDGRHLIKGSPSGECPLKLLFCTPTFPAL